MKIKNCLIVENELYLSESVAEKLEGLQYQVTIVTSINEALNINKEVTLLIVSLDFKNDEDFLTLLEKYRNITSILLTKTLDHDAISQTLKHGINDYILKPFMIDFLIQKIEFFHKFKELELNSKRYEKFLNVTLENNTKYQEIELDIELPAFVFCSNIRMVDLFVFKYSMRLSKGVELIDFEEFKNSELDNQNIIYYLRHKSHFSTEELDIIFEKAKKVKIIIGSIQEMENIPKSFSTLTIPNRETIIDDVSQIFTVHDYIKHIILQYQHVMPDTELAKYLGISRKSLWEKRRRMNIQKKKK
jgi:DNA-binding NtrC family response regulator